LGLFLTRPLVLNPGLY